MSEITNAPPTCRLIEDESSLRAILPLIAAYQRFYGCTPDDEKNLRHFGSIIRNPDAGAMFLAEDASGDPLAFATLYFVPSSLSARIGCTFNDLYTVPGTRGRGVGVSLGLFAILYAKERGFTSIDWLTSPTNKVAQRIYEGVGTAGKRTEWLHYELNIGG